MTTTSASQAVREAVHASPVLEHAAFADAPAVVAGDVELSHAALARLVADRARSWGPARRLVLVEGADADGATMDGSARLTYPWWLPTMKAMSASGSHSSKRGPAPGSTHAFSIASTTTPASI